MEEPLEELLDDKREGREDDDQRRGCGPAPLASEAGRALEDEGGEEHAD